MSIMLQGAWRAYLSTQSPAHELQLYVLNECGPTSTARLSQYAFISSLRRPVAKCVTAISTMLMRVFSRRGMGRSPLMVPSRETSCSHISNGTEVGSVPRTHFFLQQPKDVLCFRGYVCTAWWNIDSAAVYIGSKEVGWPIGMGLPLACPPSTVATQKRGRLAPPEGEFC